MAFEIAKKVVSGRKVVTNNGVAVQLSTASIKIFRIDISADTGNTDLMVVGDSSVVAAETSQVGAVLIPGNQTTTIYINDLSKLWIDSISSGDSVTFTYYRDH